MSRLSRSHIIAYSTIAAMLLVAIVAGVMQSKDDADATLGDTVAALTRDCSSNGQPPAVTVDSAVEARQRLTGRYDHIDVSVCTTRTIDGETLNSDALPVAHLALEDVTVDKDTLTAGSYTGHVQVTPSAIAAIIAAAAQKHAHANDFDVTTNPDDGTVTVTDRERPREDVKVNFTAAVVNGSLILQPHSIVIDGVRREASDKQRADAAAAPLLNPPLPGMVFTGAKVTADGIAADLAGTHLSSTPQS